MILSTIIPESLQSIDSMTWIILLSAAAIIAFILFAKAIKLTLKLAVIAVMLLLIAYFLRQAGLF
ncbi:hypothetical protein [Tichowtungia aerotolerans]|uniref:Uncharacterized protein n=1 Tax=Tichowtungia aerotolerans TaxID=2697043 RepID=A0A6P1M512_9BACT|nr:hypothetical protein [Tichowtungia aerotolerans]QHI69670.1 hypothetical protein GT409_09455 [Tichowtungia aerotolerans]